MFNYQFEQTLLFYFEQILLLRQKYSRMQKNLLLACTVELNQSHIIRVMIHQPASSYYDGQAGECVVEAEEALKLRDCITKVYAQRTGKPLWVISEDMERDVFLSAEEAQDYGVADLVALENASA